MATASVTRFASSMLSLSLVALSLSACTHAEDWRAHTSRSEQSTEGYDVSTITTQEDIAALLPEGALTDGTLDIGASTDYPPAEFLDVHGEPVGYDVDLANAIARVLGVNAQVHSAEFDSIIASIGSKYDAGISSFSITPEREAEVAMISYINVGSRFTVAAGNPDNVDPSDHLQLCGLTIGVQSGTAQEDTMKADNEACAAAGLPDIQLRSYGNQFEATTGLVGHTLDAVYSDSTVAGYATELTDGQIDVVGDVEDALPQGVVVSKADPQLQEAIRAAIQYLMDTGQWDAILAHWGINDAALSTAEINPTVDQ